MNVLWCRLIDNGASQRQRGQNRFNLRYFVRVDTAGVLATQVVTSGGTSMVPLPNILSTITLWGLPYPVCTDVSAKLVKGHPFLWEVTAQFDWNPTSHHNPADDQQQPDFRRPKWSARFVPVPCARFADLSSPSQPFQDAAGTLFDPSVDVPIYCDEIVVVRWEAAVNRGTERGYMGKSNSDNFLGALPGEALMDSIDVVEDFIQNAYWYQHTYKILIKPVITLTLPLGGTAKVGGYDPEYFLNAGPMYLKTFGDGSKQKLPVTHGGYYDGRPALLDDTGDTIGINPNTGALLGDPVFLQFTTKPRVAFETLNLTPPPGWTGS